MDYMIEYLLNIFKEIIMSSSDEDDIIIYDDDEIIYKDID